MKYLICLICLFAVGCGVNQKIKSGMRLHPSYYHLTIDDLSKLRLNIYDESDLGIGSMQATYLIVNFKHEFVEGTALTSTEVEEENVYTNKIIESMPQPKSKTEDEIYNGILLYLNDKKMERIFLLHDEMQDQIIDSMRENADKYLQENVGKMVDDNFSKYLQENVSVDGVSIEIKNVYIGYD